LSQNSLNGQAVTASITLTPAGVRRILVVLKPATSKLVTG
jgi:hypothetical protein